MTRLRWYLGTRHRLLLWTLLVGASGAAATTRLPERALVYANEPIDVGSAVYATRPMQIGAVVGFWLLGVLWMRRRERLAWRRLHTETPFETQRSGSGRRPALQRSWKGTTITAEPIGRGVVRQNGIRIEAIVDGVSKPIDLTMGYAGSGATDEGIRTGNAALDEQFVLTVEAGSDLAEVFDAEVQSALMDVSVPGTLRVERDRVSYETPSTRLRPEELGTLSRTVATVAARLERLVEIGHR